MNEVSAIRVFVECLACTTFNAFEIVADTSSKIFLSVTSLSPVIRNAKTLAIPQLEISRG